ncbi:MAG: hypothetical protein HC939_11580 [Pleurocapsa sp. SU_5_0]|nr:hypothetical protein [Pleurocapsa sp. SU_5_0]
MTQHREWQEVTRIARSIYLMLEEGKNLLNVNNQSFSNNTGHKFFDFISQKLNSSNPLQEIQKLQNLTQTTLEQIQQKLGTWNRHYQFINYQERRRLLWFELQEIAKQCNAIVRKNKPKELEPIFKQIADEIIHGVFNSSPQFLDQTNTEINQKIQQTKARLNEIENDEIRMSKQIATAQELVEKVRNEGKHKFNQVSTLLRQINELSILPESLASIAKQDIKPSDIRKLAPQFSEQVNYYKNRFDRLEALISQLNPFRVLSNINSLITEDLNSYRENSESLSQEIKNARYQLNKINIQLEQNLENLKAQRSQVKTEIKELLSQLIEQLNEQTRLEADIHRKILTTKDQVATSKSEAEFKVEQFIELWQEIRESSQLLPQLQTFFNKCFQNPKNGIADPSELSLLIQTYKSQIAKLENLIHELNPFPILSKIKNKISVNLQQQQTITVEAFKQLQDSQNQLNEIEPKLQKLIDAIKQQRYWWQEYWQTIPENLKPEEEFTDLFELNFLRRFKVQFEVWQQQLRVTETYLNRYQNLISDWIEGLKILQSKIVMN